MFFPLLSFQVLDSTAPQVRYSDCFQRIGRSGIKKAGKVMIIEELYDALVEAGASDEKARAAARAIAGHEQRFAQMENHLIRIEGTLQLHNWMLGTILALLIAVLFRVFTR